MPLPGEGETVGLTLEQKCMLQTTPNAALACAQGPKKPPVSVELTGKLTGEVSRGDPELADNGKTYETLSLSVDLRGGVKGEAELPKGLGITLEHYNGKTMTYKLRVTSERAEQIADGDGAPAQPDRPRLAALGREHHHGQGGLRGQLPERELPPPDRDARLRGRAPPEQRGRAAGQRAHAHPGRRRGVRAATPWSCGWAPRTSAWRRGCRTSSPTATCARSRSTPTASRAGTPTSTS